MNKDFYLREPNIYDETAILDYREEFTIYNEYINGSDGLTKISNYKEWLSRIEENKNTTLQRTELLFIRKSDNKIVGLVNIRHKLNDELYNYAGHIGYSIRPLERKKGYGTILLTLALDCCKQLGINKVLVICNKNNIGSKNIIKNNNGKFESEIEKDNEIYERYWIET